MCRVWSFLLLLLPPRLSDALVGSQSPSALAKVSALLSEDVRDLDTLLSMPEPEARAAPSSSAYSAAVALDARAAGAETAEVHSLEGRGAALEGLTSAGGASPLVALPQKAAREQGSAGPAGSTAETPCEDMTCELERIATLDHRVSLHAGIVLMAVVFFVFICILWRLYLCCCGRAKDDGGQVTLRSGEEEPDELHEVWVQTSVRGKR